MSANWGQSKYKANLGTRAGAGSVRDKAVDEIPPVGVNAIVKDNLGLVFNKTNYLPKPKVDPENDKVLYALVEVLASIGLDKKQIRMALGWTEDEWNTRCASDPQMENMYNQGGTRGIALIANRHFQAAMQGSIPAMQFILRTKGGFVEPKEAPMGPQEMAEAIKKFLGDVAATTGMPPLPPPRNVDGEEVVGGD
jgi:hypothetical protein